MRKFYSENENWLFTKQVKNGKPRLFAKWESVKLPHTWNDLDGQDGGMDYYRGLCFYKKKTAYKSEQKRACIHRNPRCKLLLYSIRQREIRRFAPWGIFSVSI